MEKKKTSWALPIIAALVAIVAGVAYITAKYAEQNANREKWKDYDDCGWS